MNFEVTNLSKTYVGFLGKKMDVIVQSHSETVRGNILRSYTAYIGKVVPLSSMCPKGFGNTRAEAVRNLVFELTTEPQWAAEREMVLGDGSIRF